MKSRELILLFRYPPPTMYLQRPPVRQNIYFKIIKEAYNVYFLKGLYSRLYLYDLVLIS